MVAVDNGLAARARGATLRWPELAARALQGGGQWRLAIGFKVIERRALARLPFSRNRKQDAPFARDYRQLQQQGVLPHLTTGVPFPDVYNHDRLLQLRASFQMRGADRRHNAHSTADKSGELTPPLVLMYALLPIMALVVVTSLCVSRTFFGAH